MGLGLLRMMEKMMAGRFEPSKGFLRVQSSYSTQPKALQHAKEKQRKARKGKE